MPRVQQKRGTAANLAAVNPTPAAGEIVWDSTENAIKIGDGATAWTSLAYVTATPRTHTHDDRYYTETEVDNLLAGKAASSHTHTFSQISDITFPSPLENNSIVVYTAGVGWGVANSIGTIGVGSQPLGGWPAGSVGASLAGKVDTSDARLSDARTPTAHKSTHATGGSDALTPADIGAAPTASPEFTGAITVTPAGPWSFGYLTTTGDGIKISNTNAVAGTGNYGAGISWTRNATSNNRNAGISSVQTSADPDQTGLAFFVHSSTTASADMVEAARITHSRFLGIGTTAPASALDVSGVITVSATSGSAGSYLPSLTFSGDANTGFGQVSGQSDSASVFTAGHERVRVDSSGRVGIGATPSYAIDVAYNDSYQMRLKRAGSGQGGLRIEDSAGNFHNLASASNVFVITSGATERVRLDASGRWGIGTTSPSALLDINSDTMRLRTARTPASATAAGNAGDICWDASYLYICTATNTWRRIAHSTW